MMASHCFPPSLQFLTQIDAPFSAFVVHGIFDGFTSLCIMFRVVRRAPCVFPENFHKTALRPWFTIITFGIPAGRYRRSVPAPFDGFASLCMECWMV